MWWRAVAPAAGIMAASLAWGALWPRSRWFGPVCWHGDREHDGHRLALLFENVGDDRDSVPSVLDVLEATGTPAAFAIDAHTAQRAPETLRALDAAGHLLVNAGPRFAWRNLFDGYPAWRRAIDTAEDRIHDAIGRRPLLFAPPQAIKSPVMLREAAWGGHGLVTRARGQHAWLPARLDESRLSRTPRAGVVAMRIDAPRTREQLARLIDSWRSHGRLLTRLDLLLNVPPYRRNPAGY